MWRSAAAEHLPWHIAPDKSCLYVRRQWLSSVRGVNVALPAHSPSRRELRDAERRPLTTGKSKTPGACP